MRQLILFGLAAFGLASMGLAAQDSSQHIAFDSAEMPWRPSANSPVPGAKVALLYGNPSKDGLFVLRLLLPKGYHVPPHSHPQPELISVLSGSLVIGHGATVGTGKSQRIGSGGFSALPADMVHYVFVDEETVIQISTTGPFTTTYVNPADDPRNKAN